MNSFPFKPLKITKDSRRLFSMQRGVQRFRARRRGVVFFYVAIGLFVFLGVAALSVDMGHLYSRRAKAQRAADAAALAGAYQLATGNNSAADTSAYNYAAANGYDHNAPSVVVTPTKGWEGNPNWYHVTVRRTEPVFFAVIFGKRSMEVGASATAQYLSTGGSPINPQFYGTKDGPVTYSLFGPDGLHSFGDKFSVKRLDNGNPNPDYDGEGYNFTIDVPADYAILNGTSIVQLEIFDPDCHNKDDAASADSERVDELRTPSGTSSGTPANATTTQYSLIWDKDGNPSNPDPSDHVPISGPISFGDDATTDMKWHTPTNFQFDSSQYQGGTFRLNVLSTAGSSENGFNLRAGPPHPVDADGNSVMDDTTWHDTESGAPGTSKAGQVNGTQISALGKLPMNFNINGVADIFLGYVPAAPTGGSFIVTKFDTDVGAKSVYYTCDSLPGVTFPGTLAGNDQTTTDTIPLPSNYAGGNWHAIYDAGSNDTSSWTLSYTTGSGGGSGIKLVQ